MSCEMTSPRHILDLILIAPWGTSESIGTLSCPDVGLVGSEAEKINENPKSEKKTEGRMN